MANPTPAQLHDYIAAGLVCEHLEVEGDGQHFYATIVAAEFEGLSRIRRHQRVYAALGDRMRAEIHALSMKTLTPAEWAAAGPGASLPVPAAHRH
ncbi:MAG: BolA family transcriptional regulator [Burkholderiales bacterium PBB6]|jgi:acid stress-induced BolA-like protein IbaG/YrbA|uniref:BolA family protein n=1 Tax=Ideonella margarita TaxID=2984191 RepID=A0ABU9C0M9_9BURK|nr:MAG: BolA family transcriptional regulator [Burkholderiales bacterium PBB6]